MPDPPLEILRRSLVMLRRGSPSGLDRERALDLVTRLQRAEATIRVLRKGLQELLAESGRKRAESRDL